MSRSNNQLTKFSKIQQLAPGHQRVLGKQGLLLKTPPQPIVKNLLGLFLLLKWCFTISLGGGNPPPQIRIQVGSC